MQNILLLIFFVRQIYSKIHKPPFKSVNAAKKNLTVSDFLIQTARIRYPRADYSKSRLVGNLSKIFLPLSRVGCIFTFSTPLLSAPSSTHWHVRGSCTRTDYMKLNSGMIFSAQCISLAKEMNTKTCNLRDSRCRIQSRAMKVQYTCNKMCIFI